MTMPAGNRRKILVCQVDFIQSWPAIAGMRITRTTSIPRVVTKV